METATIGVKLGLLAKKAGITQHELAEKIGCSRISINRFFCGHTEIRAGDLVKLLSALNMDLMAAVDQRLTT